MRASSWPASRWAVRECRSRCCFCPGARGSGPSRSKVVVPVPGRHSPRAYRVVPDATLGFVPQTASCLWLPRFCRSHRSVPENLWRPAGGPPRLRQAEHLRQALATRAPPARRRAVVGPLPRRDPAPVVLGLSPSPVCCLVPLPPHPPAVSPVGVRENHVCGRGSAGIDPRRYRRPQVPADLLPPAIPDACLLVAALFAASPVCLRLRPTRRVVPPFRRSAWPVRCRLPSDGHARRVVLAGSRSVGTRI